MLRSSPPGSQHADDGRGSAVHLTTHDLLRSSVNPLDTPDSTVRPSKTDLEEQLQASPSRNDELPVEVLATEANPIDTPDSNVRPPLESVMPHLRHSTAS